MRKLSDSPRNILLPRLDTLGDIILLTGFIDGVRRTFPKANITLLVREGYDQLAALLPADITWITLNLNGYQPYSLYTPLQIETELTKVRSIKWDMVCFTTNNRTWPEVLIAAVLPDAHRLAIGNTLSDDEISILLNFTGKALTSTDLFERIVAVPEWCHETEKYNIFWSECFSTAETLPLPVLTVPEPAYCESSCILANLAVSAEYFVCMPSGLQNVPIKTWPIERFAEIICWIHDVYGWLPLVVAQDSEKEIISQVVEAVEVRGVKPAIWLGRKGELDVLAALIKRAQLYIGNDSAPLHIACAVQTPVVGLYGGGTFPRFMPVGERAIGVAGELPCFGCLWGCMFGDAPCMRIVSVEDAKRAVQMVLADQPPAVNYLPVMDGGGERLEEFMQKCMLLGRQEAERQAIALGSSAAATCDESLRFNLADCQARLDALHASLSWRITAPLRKLVDRIRQLL